MSSWVTSVSSSASTHCSRVLCWDGKNLFPYLFITTLHPITTFITIPKQMLPALQGSQWVICNPFRDTWKMKTSEQQWKSSGCLNIAALGTAMGLTTWFSPQGKSNRLLTPKMSYNIFVISLLFISLVVIELVCIYHIKLGSTFVSSIHKFKCF